MTANQNKVNEKGSKNWKQSKTAITEKDKMSHSFPFWQYTYLCDKPFLFRSQTTAFALQCTKLNLYRLWVRSRVQTQLLSYVMPQLLMWRIFKILKTNIAMNEHMISMYQFCHERTFHSIQEWHNTWLPPMLWHVYIITGFPPLLLSPTSRHCCAPLFLSYTNKQ